MNRGKSLNFGIVEVDAD